MKNHLRIEIRQQDWIPGFAAYAGGSYKATGKAHVVINLGGLLATVTTKKVKEKDLPYAIAECLMHEIVHALEEWAKVEFSEKKIHKLIDAYQEKYKKVTTRGKRCSSKAR